MKRIRLLGYILILLGLVAIYNFKLSSFNHWQFWIVLVGLSMMITAQNYIDRGF